ncbi:MAG: hypothetical protein OSA95_05455 [Opitutales bacterium]|nr:hypothetical protein [Opitutales bacterium]
MGRCLHLLDKRNHRLSQDDGTPKFQMKKILLMTAALGVSVCPAENPKSLPKGEWKDYDNRYALIIMGPAGGDRLYQLYWNTCASQYKELVGPAKFSKENIRFLSYGKSSEKHKEWIHGLSTLQNVKTAYDWAASKCTDKDLLHVYWISHGVPEEFILDQKLPHKTLASWMKKIKAKVIIGVYQPCHSGAVVDEISGPNVITLTSTDAKHLNNFPWAENVQYALSNSSDYMNGDHQTRPFSSQADTDGDGVVDFLEAYLRASKVYNKERPLLDDNGDGKGSNLGDNKWRPSKPGLDGHKSSRFSLTGWR